MNVMELCTSPGIGGLELYMVRSCAHLAALGDRVLAVIGPRSRMRERLVMQGSELLDIEYRFAPLPLLAARRLARIIDDEGIDVIHFHWGKDLPLASISKFFSKTKPKLVYTRQMLMTRSKRDVYHKMIYSQVDCVVTITDELAKSVKANLPSSKSKSVRRLYYGVPSPTKFYDDFERSELRKKIHGAMDDKNNVLVGLFGRIHPKKGQHLLIKAISELSRMGCPVYGLIVGHPMDNSYPKELRRMISDFGITERVAFMDFVDSVQMVMQACDIIVLTTDRETFGLVLPEAMRAGVMVVGSNSGGVPEIIDHMQTGMMFESGNTSDLAEKLKLAIENPRLREELAAKGKKKADVVFNDDAHFEELHKILENLCLEREEASYEA